MLIVLRYLIYIDTIMFWKKNDYVLKNERKKKLKLNFEFEREGRYYNDNFHLPSAGLKLGSKYYTYVYTCIYKYTFTNI